MILSQGNYARAVILTALSVEKEAVCAHIGAISEALHPQGTIYQHGIFATSEGKWDVYVAEVGPTNPTAAFELERAISHFHPHVVLFVGVAGGLKAKDLKLGDVVAATQIYGYEGGKVDKVFLVRPDVGNVTYAMEQRARNVAGDKAWTQRIKKPISGLLPQARVGPIAAGEKVLSSTQSPLRKHLHTKYNDALAIEMEGHGFLKAARANQHVRALVIRGISDLIDEKDVADTMNFQSIASQHASAFAFEVLARMTKETSSDLSLENSGRERETTSSTKFLGDQFHNDGLLQGITQQGGNNNTINITQPMVDSIAQGRGYLKRGEMALTNGDYASSRAYLTKAMILLSEEAFPFENAQIRYLLALAYLDGKRPFLLTVELWRRIESLMKIAVDLHPTYSYLYAFALFKYDFAQNGLHKVRYTQEARGIFEDAHHLSLSSIDNKNFEILENCQYMLMQNTQIL